MTVTEIRAMHDCNCDLCRVSAAICPASASSYAQAIRRLQERIEALEAALRDIRIYSNDPAIHRTAERALSPEPATTGDGNSEGKVNGN